MKLGANNNVTPQSWLDYVFVVVAVVGICFVALWLSVSYFWACLTGNSGAWR